MYQMCSSTLGLILHHFVYQMSFLSLGLYLVLGNLVCRVLFLFISHQIN